MTPEKSRRGSGNHFEALDSRAQLK